MNSWKRARLGDISDMCLGKMLNKETNRGELQPYLANINVRWGSFDLDNLNLMRFEEHEQDRYGLKHGDIVMCEGGEPGRCAIWKEEVPNMKIQKALHRIRIKQDYSNQFIYYHFLLAGRNGELEKHFIGSTIKHLTGISLKKVEFAYPSLEYQQKIAAVLSALDAKIELNARINATLESMAKTLYDYWFVQKKVESWKVGKLGDVLKIYLGGTPSTKNPEYWENATIPWLNSGDLTEFPIIISSSFVTQKGVDNSATTILPKGSVVISLVRYIRPSIITMEACANQSVVGILETEDLKNSFIYPYLVNEVPRLMSLRTGAQQPHINKEVIDETLLYIPPKHILKEYYKVAEPIYKKIINLAFESQTLTELRDWLLPMLMNGQVRVG